MDVDGSFPHCRPGLSTWYRAHSWRPGAQDGGCWFFASASESGGGRFDLETPRGTCYWANSEPVAARERLGRPGDIVAHDEVAGIVISSAAVNPGRLADLMAGDAARRGVCQELTSSVPYSISQLWAAAFDTAGYDGIRYQPRFSTERAEAVALFGATGAGIGRSVTLSHRPAADVLRDAGYTVLGAPRAEELSPLMN